MPDEKCGACGFPMSTHLVSGIVWCPTGLWTEAGTKLIERENRRRKMERPFLDALRSAKGAPNA